MRLRPPARGIPFASDAVSLGVLAGLTLCAGLAAAQTLSVIPTLSINQTVTDNYRGVGGIDGGSEGITTVTPGLRLTSRRGRVQGSVDYGLTGVYHARDSSANSFQNRLAASVTADAIPEHLSITATGNISRQAVSAFGRQAVDGTLTDVNQTELRTFSVSPRLQGEIGGVVAVQVGATATHTSASSLQSTSTQSGNVTLSSSVPGPLGWSLGATRQVSEFANGRQFDNDRLTATAIFSPNSDWRFRLRAGQERTDIATGASQTYNNWGVGVSWAPSPRTSMTLDADRRFFGNGYDLSISHRQRKAIWRYSASRDVSDGVGVTGSGGVRAYDLYYDLFSSQEPDPVKRDALVRSFLQRNGIGAGQLINVGFLNTSPVVQRRQDLSLALQGRRSSVNVTAFVSDSGRASSAVPALGDIAGGPVSQRGLSVVLSHQLTPRDTVNLTATGHRTTGNTTRAGNTLSSLSAGWSKSLGSRASFSLTVRHTEFDSTAATAYTENAVSAAFATRF